MTKKEFLEILAECMKDNNIVFTFSGLDVVDDNCDVLATIEFKELFREDY
jgi:hypothetical protein